MIFSPSILVASNSVYPWSLQRTEPQDLSIERQPSQSRHGLKACRAGFPQQCRRAIMRAVVPLPVPGAPVNASSLGLVRSQYPGRRTC